MESEAMLVDTRLGCFHTMAVMLFQESSLFLEPGGLPLVHDTCGTSISGQSLCTEFFEDENFSLPKHGKLLLALSSDPIRSGQVGVVGRESVSTELSKSS
jgi:hypothetical protein